MLRGAALSSREENQADAGMEKDALKEPLFISQCCNVSWELQCQLGLASCNPPGAQRRCWLLILGFVLFSDEIFSTLHTWVVTAHQLWVLFGCGVEKML